MIEAFSDSTGFGRRAAWSVTTIAFIVHLPVWSLLSTYDGDAASPGAQRRYILNPRCHWCWRDETPVGHPRTGGHAFWNPELASAEDQYASVRKSG
jgi:cytochrome c5